MTKQTLLVEPISQPDPAPESTRPEGSCVYYDICGSMTVGEDEMCGSCLDAARYRDREIANHQGELPERLADFQTYLEDHQQ